MPTLTRYFIKSGLIFFGLAILTALLLALQEAFALFPASVKLMPVFWHFLVFGWVTQIIMGVSVWMFPRKTRKASRGDETLAWVAFILLNIGLVLRAVAEPWAGNPMDTWLNGTLAASAVLQWAAGMSYIIVIWPRVRGRRKRKRKRKSKKQEASNHA